MEDLRENIPIPKNVPYIGNIFSLEGDNTFESIERMAEIGGGIFKLKIFGIERIVVADAELMGEICDEKRFWKGPSDALLALNGNDPNPRFGLFSAPTEDSMDWQVAHRVLVPAFGPLAIEKMFPEMYDIATQLVMKWARMGVDYRIPATEDFTRLTLDTIALCSMDYRFNSFYDEKMHPFVENMNTLLALTNERLKPKGALKALLPWDDSVRRAREAKSSWRTLAQDSQHRDVSIPATNQIF